MTELGEGVAAPKVEPKEETNICKPCLLMALKAGTPFAALAAPA